MPTIIKHVDDLFNPPEIKYTHQILADKIHKNNVTITGLYDPNTNPNSPWIQMRNGSYRTAPINPPDMDRGVYLLRALNVFSYENIFGFLVSGRSSKTVNNVLTFTFQDSVRSISTGSLLNLNVSLVSVTVVSTANKPRFASVISLGGSTPYDESQFLVQSYLGILDSDAWIYNSSDNTTVLNYSQCGENSDPACGASVSIKIYVTDSNGTVVPNVKLIYPFTDIDQGGGIFTVGGYSEKVRLPSNNCDYVYVQSTVGSYTSWLVCNDQTIYDGSYSSQYLVFRNNKPEIHGQDMMEPDNSAGGRMTGIMAVFDTGSSGYTAIWEGAKCGTSIKGEPTGLFSVTFDPNGGSNTELVPYKTYHVQGQSVTIPNASPARYSNLIFDVNHESGSNPSDTSDPSRITMYSFSESKPFTFIGWSRTKYEGSKTSEDGVVEYDKNDQLTPSISSDIVLYSVWTHPKIEYLPEYHEEESGVRWIHRNSFDEYRLDLDTPWTTVRNGSEIVNINDYLSEDRTIFAKWNYAITINANPGKITRRYLNDDPPFDQDVYWKVQGQNLSYQDNPELDYTEYGGEPGITRAGHSATSFYLRSDPSIVYNIKLVYDKDSVDMLYVNYEPITVTITFKDGYSPKGSDTIQTLVKNYGYQLDLTRDVPVPGTGTFINPNPNDKFMGWSISLTDVQGYPIKIYSDMVITALWGYTPIWIMVPDEFSQYGKKWVKYEPKEEQI